MQPCSPPLLLFWFLLCVVKLFSKVPFLGLFGFLGGYLGLFGVIWGLGFGLGLGIPLSNRAVVNKEDISGFIKKIKVGCVL